MRQDVITVRIKHFLNRAHGGCSSAPYSSGNADSWWSLTSPLKTIQHFAIVHCFCLCKKDKNSSDWSSESWICDVSAVLLVSESIQRPFFSSWVKTTTTISRSESCRPEASLWSSTCLAANEDRWANERRSLKRNHQWPDAPPPLPSVRRLPLKATHTHTQNLQNCGLNEVLLVKAVDRSGWGVTSHQRERPPPPPTGWGSKCQELHSLSGMWWSLCALITTWSHWRGKKEKQAF